MGTDTMEVEPPRVHMNKPTFNFGDKVKLTSVAYKLAELSEDTELFVMRVVDIKSAPDFDPIVKLIAKRNGIEKEISIEANRIVQID